MRSCSIRMLALLAALASSGLPLGASSVPPAGPPQETPFDTGDVVAFEVPEPAGMRKEYFALELPAAGSTPLAEPPSGVCALLRSDVDGVVRLESRTTYFDVDTRVIHTEELTPDGPKLVWREVRERSGRTVILDWVGGEWEVASVDWSGLEAERRPIDPARGVVLPSFLLEEVRSGSYLSGGFDVFDPLANGVEELVGSTRTVWLPVPLAAPLRHFVWRRADGTLAGEYWFAGRELVGFRLQAGGPVARRIDAATYEDLLEAHERTRETVGAAPPLAGDVRAAGFGR